MDSSVGIFWFHFLFIKEKLLITFFQGSKYWVEKKKTTSATYFLYFRHFKQRPVQFKDKSIKTEAEKTERWRHNDTCARRQPENIKTACLMDQRTKIILTPEQTGHQTSTGIVRATQILTKEAPQVRGVRLIREREPVCFLSDAFTCC